MARSDPARPPGIVPARQLSRLLGGRERVVPPALVAGAVFVDMLLYGLVVPIVPRYARSLGAGTGLLGIVFASYAIGLIAVSPIAALLTERLGARLVLVTGGGGILASALVWAGATNIPLLVAARAAQGVAAALTWTAGLAFAAVSYRPSRRGQVMGWLMTAMAAGSALGAPVGGALADTLGYRAPFLLTACLAVAEVLAFWVLLPRSPAKQEQSKVITGACALLANSSSRYTLLAVLSASTAVSAAEPFLPLWLHHDLNLSPGAIGLLFGLTMIISAAASPLSGAVASRIRPARLMAGGLVGVAAMMPVLVLSRSVLAESCVLVALGACLAAVFTPALAELASIVDATGAGYGTSYALVNIVYAGGMLFGPVEAGLIAQGLGLTAAFAVTGVLCLIPIVTSWRTVAWRCARPGRGRPAQDSPDPAPAGKFSRCGSAEISRRPGPAAGRRRR